MDPSGEPDKEEPPKSNIHYSLKEYVTKDDLPNSESKSPLFDNYSSEGVRKVLLNSPGTVSKAKALRDIEFYINKSFSHKLLEYIRKKHLRNSDIYNAAWMDRRLFSKIMCDPDYKPAKDTCISLALGLKLSLPEATDLLNRAGYTLSHSSKRDVIIEYFFREKYYDLMDINEILCRFDQKLIK